MSSEKPRIVFPTSSGVMKDVPFGAPRRVCFLMLEFLFTVCMSFLILIVSIHLLGLSDDRFLDASPMGILHVTIVCTLLVYAVVDGMAAVLHYLRHSVSQSAYDEEMGTAEDGWDDTISHTGYGTVEATSPRNNPFAMSPGRMGPRQPP
ncbi:hypothetical protein C8R43DRAFT_1132298 [Mycena crocata]|nr:hypothetical protein C8R43DRAFT_1132298 [Mycena crocata]